MSPWNPDQAVFCWVAGWRTTCGSHSISHTLQRAACVFPSSVIFHFVRLGPTFSLLLCVKGVRAYLLWFIMSDLFARRAAIVCVAMRNDDDSLRNLSISLSLLSWWTGARCPRLITLGRFVPWKASCLKRHPSIQLARLPPTKNGRKYVFNNVEGLKGNYNTSIGKTWPDLL